MMNASPQSKTISKNTHLVYAAVAPRNLSELCRLSTESFGAVEFVSTAGLVFATSRVDELSEVHNVSAAQISDFSHIVNELHRVTDVLPFRYGAVLHLDQMKELAERQGAVYIESLKRVEACSEINSHWAVRFTSTANGADSTKTNKQVTSLGGDYLRRKYLTGKTMRSMEAAASVIAISLVNEMGSVLIDTNVSTRHIKHSTTTEPRSGSHFIVSLNLLVQREAVTHAMDTLRSTKLESDFPVLVSGPWPAFSFLNEINVDTNAIDLCQCKGVQSNVA